MRWSLQSPLVIVLCGVIAVALIAFVTKRVILPLLGLEWPFRRVDAPWRFSLRSITILVGLSAIVLGLLRESLDAALLGLGLVLVTWLTVVRYVGFRQALARRRTKEFTAVLQPYRANEPDAP